MTSMYTPADPNTAFPRLALVARLVDPANNAGGGRTVQPVREHILDHSELTDLVAEAIAESQRVHAAHGHTVWGDAAEAATLILRHVAELTGVQPGGPDSESGSVTGVSVDHV